MNSASSNIAANIRALRDIKGISQQSLAQTAGVARPNIANLESGSANPTINLLTKVAEALRVSVEELISSPRENNQLTKAADLKTIERGAVTISKLLPSPLPHTDFERMEFPTGARMVGSPHRKGTHEYLVCERGSIRLAVEGDAFILKPGDVASFRGDQKHSYHNAGAKPAVGYSIVIIAK